MRVRGKRDGERRKKRKEMGTTLPFTISGESVVETSWGQRQSWSTQRELHVGTEIRVFLSKLQEVGVFSYIGSSLFKSRKWLCDLAQTQD